MTQYHKYGHGLSNTQLHLFFNMAPRTCNAKEPSGVTRVCGIMTRMHKISSHVQNPACHAESQTEQIPTDFRDLTRHFSFYLFALSVIGTPTYLCFIFHTTRKFEHAEMACT